MSEATYQENQSDASDETADDNSCPQCGAPGIKCCAGCGHPTHSLLRDCGCPAGTAYTCSAQCSRGGPK